MDVSEDERSFSLVIYFQGYKTVEGAAGTGVVLFNRSRFESLL